MWEECPRNSKLEQKYYVTHAWQFIQITQSLWDFKIFQYIQCFPNIHKWHAPKNKPFMTCTLKVLEKVWGFYLVGFVSIMICFFFFFFINTNFWGYYWGYLLTKLLPNINGQSYFKVPLNRNGVLKLFIFLGVKMKNHIPCS